LEEEHQDLTGTLQEDVALHVPSGWMTYIDGLAITFLHLFRIATPCPVVLVFPPSAARSVKSLDAVFPSLIVADGPGHWSFWLPRA
jgi:hypothetical protein